jgi:hypothetical protein
MRIRFHPLTLRWDGVAHAISPDAACGHPALRSLGGNLASQSLLRSVSYAARLARATPRALVGQKTLDGRASSGSCVR